MEATGLRNAARELGIGRSTLREWLDAGAPHSLDEKGRHVLDIEAVNQWAAERDGTNIRSPERHEAECARLELLLERARKQGRAFQWAEPWRETFRRFRAIADSRIRSLPPYLAPRLGAVAPNKRGAKAVDALWTLLSTLEFDFSIPASGLTLDAEPDTSTPARLRQSVHAAQAALRRLEVLKIRGEIVPRERIQHEVIEQVRSYREAVRGAVWRGAMTHGSDATVNNIQAALQSEIDTTIDGQPTEVLHDHED